MNVRLLERFRSSSSPPARWTRALLAWQPLTGRGAAVLLLGTIGLRFFAIPEFDLVADVLGTSALALLALALFFSIMIRFRLSGRLSAETRFDETAAYSKSRVPSGIVLQESTVPPFFLLRVTRVFAQPGVHAPAHLLRGRVAPGEVRHLIDDVTFPHRDLWEIRSIRCDLEDVLGLTRLTWFVPLQSGCEVSARTVPITPLPVIAASARAGDEQMQARDRTGELFDIKPYDPSDGLKRILWKTYAKSGQLVARRPEPAIIPDGEVALYLVAGPDDDVVAGACQGYIDQLTDFQVRVLFGTDGMLSTTAQQTSADLPPALCSDSEMIRHAINRTASTPDAGTGRGFPAFLSAIAESDRVVHQVIVFGSERHGNGWFEHISRMTAAHSIKLAIALVPEALDPDLAIARVRQRHAVGRAPGLFLRLPRFARRAIAIVIPRLRPFVEPFAASGELLAVAQEIQDSGADVYVVQTRDGAAELGGRAL